MVEYCGINSSLQPASQKKLLESQEEEDWGTAKFLSIVF